MGYSEEDVAFLEPRDVSVRNNDMQWDIVNPQVGSAGLQVSEVHYVVIPPTVFDTDYYWAVYDWCICCPEGNIYPFPPFDNPAACSHQVLCGLNISDEGVVAA